MEQLWLASGEDLDATLIRYSFGLSDHQLVFHDGFS